MPTIDSPTVRFEKVTTLKGKLREEFTGIYFSSFPAHERESLERIDHRLEGNATLHGAFVGEELVGFALMLPLAVTGVTLLAYLAVADSHRNQGLGRAFLHFLRRTWGDEPGASGILLELESDEWGAEEERYLRARRLAFYRRNGAALLPLREHLLLPTTDEPGFICSKLMWLPLADPPPRGLRLRECVLSFLAQAYGLYDEEPIVVAALRLLPE